MGFFVESTYTATVLGINRVNIKLKKKSRREFKIIQNCLNIVMNI